MPSRLWRGTSVPAPSGSPANRVVDRVARADLRSLSAVAACVILAGTPFGAGGTVEAVRATLRALAAATTDGGRVVGDL